MVQLRSIAKTEQMSKSVQTEPFQLGTKLKLSENNFREFFLGSIISVVGKITIEIMELFECRQKVP